MLSDTLWFKPQILSQVKDLLNLQNLGKFSEDNSFGSDFRDL